MKLVVGYLLYALAHATSWLLDAIVVVWIVDGINALKAKRRKNRN